MIEIKSNVKYIILPIDGVYEKKNPLDLDVKKILFSNSPGIIKLDL